MKKIKIYNEFSTNRNMPVNLEKKDIHLFKSEFSKSFKSTHILFINNVSINYLDLWKYFGLMSFSKHTKMKQYKSIKKLKTFLKRLLKAFYSKNKIIEIKKGSWILDEKSFHYFHWMCDALPRLIQIKDFTNKYPILIPDIFLNYKYIEESLKILDVNYKIYDSSKDLRVKKLLISSHIAESGNYNKENILKTREILTDKSQILNTDKIWLSREKSKHRKIKNEDELKKILYQFNYKIVHPEDYSFQEQSQILSNSKVVAGLHGGGLTNIIYLKENSILFEIRRDGDEENNCYFSLASELDLKYFYLNAKKLGEDLYVDDVKVNVQEFEEILEKIENEII